MKVVGGSGDVVVVVLVDVVVVVGATVGGGRTVGPDGAGWDVAGSGPSSSIGWIVGADGPLSAIAAVTVAAPTSARATAIHDHHRLTNPRLAQSLR